MKALGHVASATAPPRLAQAPMTPMWESRDRVDGRFLVATQRRVCLRPPPSIPLSIDLTFLHFHQVDNSGPAPGSYDVSKSVSPTKRAAPAFSISGRPKDHRSSDTPGPGNYSLGSSIGHGGFSISGRHGSGNRDLGAYLLSLSLPLFSIFVFFLSTLCFSSLVTVLCCIVSLVWLPCHCALCHVTHCVVTHVCALFLTSFLPLLS